MLARPPHHVAEMREQGGALVFRISSLQMKLRAQHRVPPRGVDEVSGAMQVGLAVYRNLDGGAVAVQLDSSGLRALERARAAAGGVLEQHQIELVPLHLVSEGPRGVQAAIEA